MNRCPECGREQADHDGFGLLVCIGVKDGSCSYCTHPSATGQSGLVIGDPEAVLMVCDACGASLVLK